MNRIERLGCRYSWQRLLLGVLALSWVVRLSSYLTPIRAGDIAQERSAVEFVDRHGLPLGTLLTRDQEHMAVVALEQVSPRFVQAILSAEDQRFYRHGPLDLQTVGRSLSFGVESVLNLPFPAAVKTGTSSDFRDTWTVGFTRDYTVAT